MIPIPDEDQKSTPAVNQITDEDIAFSTLLELHPIMESLVNRIDLCSIKTGERFIKTEKRLAVKNQQTSENYSMLLILAGQVLSCGGGIHKI